MREILAQDPAEARRLHEAHINPTLVEALGLLGFGRSFVRAEGFCIWDEKGEEYLDFLAGYGSVPLGHNHPEVIAAIDEVLRGKAPNFLQIAPQPLASAVASRLARVAPGDLSMAYLMSSGSEAVDGALKLARAVTRRERFLYANGGYHGTTFGALSVTGGRRARGPFEPLLPGCVGVPWGDVDALEAELRKRDVAAVILEPMQAEGGMNPAPPDYLRDVARHCKRFGTMLILDEIQTGLGRAGAMFLCEEEGVEPDVLVVGKGLSGGLVPVSAYVTRRALWERAYGSLDRYDAHCSTFTGGSLACAAAIATLEVIERDRLPARAKELGERLGDKLRASIGQHPLVRDIRGRGLLYGVELRSPKAAVAADLIGGWAAVGMIERGVVAQVAVHAPEVIRAEPPLIVGEPEVDQFVAALTDTLATHSTGVLASALGAVKRIVSTRLSGMRGGST
jgi:putrescine aminotransferase